MCERTRCWLAAVGFPAIIADPRAPIRLAVDRAAQPTAAILDSRTPQGPRESGHRAGSDGYKRRTGGKVQPAVDTLGQLRALHVAPASEQDRAQVERLAAAVEDATGASVG